jgi:hypothetical protein
MCSCGIGLSDRYPARHGHQKGRIEVLHAGLIYHWHGNNEKVWIWIQHKAGSGINIKPESGFSIKSVFVFRKGLNLDPQTLTGYLWKNVPCRQSSYLTLGIHLVCNRVGDSVRLAHLRHQALVLLRQLSLDSVQLRLCGVITSSSFIFLYIFSAG